MNTFSLGIRNAFRNTVRSASIMLILGLSIGLCLVMLIAYQAVGVKIDQVKTTIGNTITIVPAGFSSFSQENNALTSSQLNNVKAIPHIVGLTESLNDRLITAGMQGFGRAASTAGTTSLSSPVILNDSSHGGAIFRSFAGGSLPANFSLPITVLGTTDPSHLSGSTLTITSGKTLDGNSDTNSALVSNAMASKNNLSIGSTFSAYNTTLTVAGIFSSTTQGGNNTIILSLPTLQRLSGQSGDITNAIATVDSLDNLSAATTAVKISLGSTADVQSAQDQADATVKPLQNVQSIALISLIGAVIAGATIILLTMIMIVRERRREIGILKAIGASNLRVMLQFMTEAVTLTLAGALVGIFIGVIGANPVTNMLVSNSISSATTSTFASGTQRQFGGGARFFMKPTGSFLARNGDSFANSIRNVSTNVGWNVVGEGIAAALVIAVVGSTLAGWMIARVKPYEVMRAE